MSYHIDASLEVPVLEKSFVFFFPLGDGASENGYDVTFDVVENKRVTGGISTLVGTNDASLVLKPIHYKPIHFVITYPMKISNEHDYSDSL